MVESTPRRQTIWQWLANPIRLSGFLSLFFLAGPGSLYGLSLLLIHAGAPPIVTPVAPQIHALLQSIGFFLILIWGFLVHGLPGMLGAKPYRTRWMRIPMLLTAAGLVLVWTGAAWGVGQAWPAAGWIILFLGTFSGSAILLHSAFLTHGRWLHRPMPMVVFPMAIPPFAILASWLTPGWVYLSGAEIALWGCLIPVILAMGYRMFPSMLGLEYPKEKWFDAASLAWMAGFAGKLLLSPQGQWGWSADAMLLIASVLFVVAMRVAERPRDVFAGGRLPALDHSLMLHVRIAFLFMVASSAVSLAAHAVADGAFYVKDLGRHYMVIGFCLIIVSGLTQRVFPSFLRSKSSSAPWMNLNLALLGAGLLLRTGEIFLPASALAVRVSAYLLYAGVLGYAGHILRGMIVPHRKTEADANTIRRQEGFTANSKE